MFSNIYRHTFIILLAVYSFLNTLSVEVFKYYPVKISKSVLLIIFILVIFGIWEGNFYLEKKYPPAVSDKKQVRNFLFKNILGSLIFTFIVTVSVGLIALYLGALSSYDSKLLSIKLFLMFSFRINLFLNVINIIFLYISQLKKTQSEAEKFKKISAQAQLQVVKNQINPHFLFNNLNVLSALIAKNSDASIEFVNQFAKVYRYVLQSQEKELVELGDELDFIDAYKYLMKKRFEEGFDIIINIDATLRNNQIIPVALQMLIENALKHNITSKKFPLIIEITNEGFEKLVIKNNLQKKPVSYSDSTQIGLSNIAKRYAFFGEAKIEIESTSNHFTVKLPLFKISKNGIITKNIEPEETHSPL
jgi:two-component system, LytTR family, sensor kinase